MSKIRTAALGAVFTAAFAIIAGAQAPAKTDTAHKGHDVAPRRERVEGKRGMQGQRRGMKARGMRGMKQGRGRGGRPAAELNLTEAQRTRIQAIHQKYLPQLRTLQDQGTTQMRAMRDARQKGDTSAAARQRFQQQREQFRQRVTSLRQQEQNEVRGVLTAEQAAKWDAAAKQRKERVEGRRERMKQRRGARSGARTGA